jgi:hypothetical protein
MAEPAPDRDPSPPSRQGVASLRLLQHREGATRQSPPEKGARLERPRDARLVVTPTRQPSDAECYGCVDWFHF